MALSQSTIETAVHAMMESAELLRRKDKQLASALLRCGGSVLAARRSTAAHPQHSCNCAHGCGSEMVAVAQVVPGLIVSSIGLALNFTAKLMSNNAKDPDVCTTIETLVRSKGYPFETHEVATEDGYLLQLHRIRHGRDGHCGANETSSACCERGPLFFMTGLLADSASIVLDFPKQSLGYVLADNGYDVWLGNVRGNTYGKKHKNLDVKSKKFWNFSFHEHAIFDVPAQVDYILKETKRKDLLYIGMSQGTLTFFTMLAEKPWYNDRIKAFAGLAPFFKLAHLKVPPLAVFSPYAEAPLRLVHAAGGYELLPQGMPVAGLVRQFCGYATRGLCSLFADNFANFGSRYINEDSSIPVPLAGRDIYEEYNSLRPGTTRASERLCEASSSPHSLPAKLRPVSDADIATPQPRRHDDALPGLPSASIIPTTLSPATGFMLAACCV
ncbi:hypothetical protein HPB49_011355 [Dermacentor silvarum]|uniref:Uncharacterized protein n=1 Tax=Dermacentor silvarum TaxID=543639 RepID=A0ACB8DC36_DERSI|nr:hypothetical protein HPB49_011355 [Dermacentor silvarum]